MKELTARQAEILRYVASFHERMGRTPTGPEIARGFKFRDHSTAYQHLRQIEAKGFIELVQSARRAPICIRLLDRAHEFMSAAWPILGAIPAGPLAEHPADVQGRVEHVEDLVPGLRPGDYFLVVSGDSMVEAGLQPGGYVVIRPGAEVHQGDICAVWIDGEGGTLKHVYQEGETMRLVPANHRYSPQSYPVDAVHIQGVLVASLAVQAFR